MNRVLCTFAILCALTAYEATAWWCTGHMIVAEIAMKVVSTSTAAKLRTAIDNFDAMGPWPLSPDPVQTACWADDIKNNQRAMNEWHYIDTPYNPDNIHISGNPVGGDNIAVQINNMYASLKNSPNKWETSFAIAWLIHLIGDVHQPLHCISLYDSTFPDGDIGGNAFKVISPSGKLTNLHSFWDSICDTEKVDFSRPLNASAKSNISSLAQEFMDAYTLSHAEKTVYDPNIMINESYWAAVDYVYADLTPRDQLTDDYRVACEYVAKRQIALAGYRLGNQLDYLLGGN